jgi:hypothetical protein
MMTQFELIDRLCAVNTLLTDIVREQAEIMAQHGIEPIQTQDEATERLDDLFGKYKRAEDEKRCNRSSTSQIYLTEEKENDC